MSSNALRLKTRIGDLGDLLQTRGQSRRPQTTGSRQKQSFILRWLPADNRRREQGPVFVHNLITEKLEDNSALPVQAGDQPLSGFVRRLPWPPYGVNQRLARIVRDRNIFFILFLRAWLRGVPLLSVGRFLFLLGNGNRLRPERTFRPFGITLWQPQRVENPCN